MKSVFAHDHIFIHDHGFYHSKAGFPEVVLNRYVEAFGELNVICRRRVAPAAALERISSEKIRFFPQKNLRSIRAPIVYSTVRQGVADALSNAEVLIARLPSTLGLMAILEARRRGIPYIIEVVGNAYESNMLHGSRIGRLIAPIEHALTAREVRRAKHVIYITEKYLQSIYPTNGTKFVCPNVLIESRDNQILERRLRRAQSNRRFIIGLIGSLDVEYKGHRIALEVIQKLSKEGDVDVELQLVGAGSSARWEVLARALGVHSRVRFLGTLSPGPCVMEWLDQIDVLMQPSRTEGQGRAIIEAMSRGAPVVASRAGGIPELLEERFMADATDTTGLTNRLRGLLKNRTRYVENCRRNWLASERFVSTQVEAKRRDVFQAIKLAIEQGVPSRAKTGRD